VIRSMTAFGRGEDTNELGHFVVEIQSVNRKHLEIDVNLPRELSQLEPQVRSRINSALGRGKVTCTLCARLAPGQAHSVEPNEPLAHMIKASYEQLRQALGYDEPVKFDAIARNKEVLTHNNHVGDPGLFWPSVSDALASALEQLETMKLAEGQMIADDFRQRLEAIAGHAYAVEQAAPHAVERYRARLSERLRELAIELVDNEDRLVREAAILAEKLDITEEIVRLRSHIEQFRTYLDSNDTSVGRTLDFLSQEMHRELNTIGSKSQDLEVTNRVVLAKSELEKIREQVRNVE
jgi:uncharacterized protein (TIGR00255 family)